MLLKLFSLALANFLLTVAVQCGILACPTDAGGPQPSSLDARGSICVFKCPESDAERNDLSDLKFYPRFHSLKLQAFYQHHDRNSNCSRYTVELLNNGGNSTCHTTAPFYFPRTGFPTIGSAITSATAHRSPVPEYFQARTKLGRSNKVKRGIPITVPTDGLLVDGIDCGVSFA